jgi:hypothetical protein
MNAPAVAVVFWRFFGFGAMGDGHAICNGRRAISKGSGIVVGWWPGLEKLLMNVQLMASPSKYLTLRSLTKFQQSNVNEADIGGCVFAGGPAALAALLLGK